MLNSDGAHFQTTYTLQGREFKHVLSRLDALLVVLKSCYGKECHEPWNTLHPDAKVTSIRQALQPAFDDFYEHQPKVHFDSCQLGYLRDEEGPQHVHAFGADGVRLVDQGTSGGKRKSFEYDGPLEWWT